jgi:prepilin-type N-terminal cleavage/methylation domain-containing protein
MRTLSAHMGGFTLVELAVTILVLGLLLGFSIPAFHSISASYQLKGASENIAAQIRLSREKAIGINQQQHWHFWQSTNAYHAHDLTTGQVFGPWPLPRRVRLVSDNDFIMLTDGRASASTDIIVEDFRGNRDTVTVQVSGLVLTH